MAKLPSLTSKLAPDVRRFLDRLREAFDGKDPLVTEQTLVDAGTHSRNATGGLVGLTPQQQCAVAPAPENLTASGAMTSILLQWDDSGWIDTLCHSFTQVYRSETDDVSDAVMIGSSNGRMYTDAVGQSAAYFYWVRFMNIDGTPGPYNKLQGTLGETADNVAYLMDVLADVYGSDSEAPFFQLDEPLKVSDSLTIPAGTYMKSARIHEAQITDAMIASLSVDKLTVTESATLAEAIIGVGDITDAMIGNVIKATSGQWAIYKDGRIEARSLVLLDQEGNVIFGAEDGIVSKISAANVEGLGPFASLNKIQKSQISTYIETGAITNAYIGDTIQSASFVEPADVTSENPANGWKLDKNGKMVLIDAEFYGELNIKSANPESGDYMTMDNDSISVFSDGVERVKIGKLS